MDEQVCPRCKTSQYRNPSLKLMVNVCGHSLCTSCMDLLFIKGSGNCPECGTILKRNAFRVQMFEDAFIEKEVEIRKRVLKDFNKKEEDFQSLSEYNNYLEEIERIIYNLTNNIDTLETNKFIDQYKRENKDVINKNRIRSNIEITELDQLIEEEKMHEREKRETLMQEELDLKKKRIMEKEALIDELMFSDTDARHILNNFTEIKKSKQEEEISEESVRRVVKKASHFSTGIKIGDNSQQACGNVPKIVEGPLYEYSEPVIIVDGPVLPRFEDLSKLGYLKHWPSETVEEIAGGSSSSLSCMRVLQEAFFGLCNVVTT